MITAGIALTLIGLLQAFAYRKTLKRDSMRGYPQSRKFKVFHWSAISGTVAFGMFVVYFALTR